MKRYISLFVLAAAMAICTHDAFGQVNFLAQVKANIRGEFGCDIGIRHNDIWGVKVGMMSDLNREKSSEDGYSKSLGKNYRLSYTAGPTVRIVDWFWIGATAGYGEYGKYGYSVEQDLYGVLGKVKGLEVGLQLQFDFKGILLEVGYGTIPKGFSLKKPLHDIVFGVGMKF